MEDNHAYENIEQSTSFSTKNSVGKDEENFTVNFPYNAERKNSEIDIPAPYAGMPKEVLLHYSRQKKYVWARNILTGAVVLTILTLFSMVIALISVSPSCQQFWQKSPIYQVYPKSFYDNSNDGIGDLNGVKAKLDYLNDDLGVTTIWLNPVYKSPQKDNGYDISDYESIDPIFGTMNDMDDLITEIHNRGMKIIMDFVPNHTSDQHEWFNASSDPDHSKHLIYKDYYVWVNGTDGTAAGIPNNWQSVFSNVESSAWEWNPKREQFYYHAFLKEQPDLNIRNPEVQKELKTILSNWMDKGVDGFRCDAVAFLLEATHLRDNPVKNQSMVGQLSYGDVYPDYTENQLGIHDIVADWRTVLKKYSSEPGVYRFMETVVYDDVDTVVRYYGTSLVKEADFPLNFQLLELSDSASWNAANIESTVMKWMRKMPSDRWPNWVIGNHDNSRVVSRIGIERAKLAAVLTMTLSGTPTIYYGEEIGMTNGIIDTDERDIARSPMQWSTDVNAGFCSNCSNPWLPVNDNYKSGVNAQDQMDNNPTSIMALYKKLIQKRNDVEFARGSLCLLYGSQKSFIYVREMPGSWSTMILINFDIASADQIDLLTTFSNLPGSGTITFSSINDQNIGFPVGFNNVQVQPGEALMIYFKPQGNSYLFSQNALTATRCFVSKKVCIDVLGLLEVC